MRRVLALALLTTSCMPGMPADTRFVQLDFETRLAFTNFSSGYYATLGLRESGSAAPFRETPLLPPGGTFRAGFLDFLGVSCPDLLDMQVRVYARVNEDVPIGEDDGEAIAPSPIVTGEIHGLPACALEPLESYTIGNLDAPRGRAGVRIAECTTIDDVIRDTGIFPNPRNAWEINGVEVPALAALPPPALLEPAPVRGRIAFADGRGVENVLVLLRTLIGGPQDCRPADDTNRVFSKPIAFDITDGEGVFMLDRPPGIYQVEAFSDDYALRPAAITVETPLETIQIVAEAVE